MNQQPKEACNLALSRWKLIATTTPLLQSLPSPTAVNVPRWIIRKDSLRKGTLTPDMILIGAGISHVTGRPALSAGHVVLLRPVLMISYCYFYFAVGVLLMLLD